MTCLAAFLNAEKRSEKEMHFFYMSDFFARIDFVSPKLKMALLRSKIFEICQVGYQKMKNFC